MLFFCVEIGPRLGPIFSSRYFACCVLMQNTKKDTKYILCPQNILGVSLDTSFDISNFLVTSFSGAMGQAMANYLLDTYPRWVLSHIKSMDFCAESEH